MAKHFDYTVDSFDMDILLSAAQLVLLSQSEEQNAAVKTEAVTCFEKFGGVGRLATVAVELAKYGCEQEGYER